jgi:glycosyltransferase involved in cell wall biosynthesis
MLDWFSSEKLYTSSKKLRVGIVVSSFEGLFINSGIGTFYSTLAEFLIKTGHSVTVVYTREQGLDPLSFQYWVSYYETQGLELVLLPHTVSSRIDGSYFMRKSFEVYNYLNTRQFDLIHFPDWEGVGYHSLLAKQDGLSFQNTVLSVGLHGPWRWVISANTNEHDACLSEPEEIEIDYMERKSVELADLVYTPSQYLVNWLQAQSWSFPSNIVMLPYLPGKAIKNSIAENPVDQVLAASDSKEVRELVFFGRLETRKGLTLFCDALDLIAEENLDIKVTFLGRSVEDVEGLSSSQYIYQRAAGKWSFDWQILSNKNRQDAMAYLHRKNVLVVIPSLIDNAPYTVYECLYAGIPFIASNTPSIAPLVAEESRSKALFELSADAIKNKVVEVYQQGLFQVAGVFDVNSVEVIVSKFTDPY